MVTLGMFGTVGVYVVTGNLTVGVLGGVFDAVLAAAGNVAVFGFSSVCLANSCEGANAVLGFALGCIAGSVTRSVMGTESGLGLTNGLGLISYGVVYVPVADRGVGLDTVSVVSGLEIGLSPITLSDESAVSGAAASISTLSTKSSIA